MNRHPLRASRTLLALLALLALFSSEALAQGTAVLMGTAVDAAVYCGDDAGNPSDAACTEPGYGLNPEFASVCDPTQLRCVPERRPPSLRE